MKTLRSLLASSVLLAGFFCTGVAFAVPKVSVAPFSGPDNEAVHDQLLREVCETLDCVSPKRVMSGSKIDYGKVTDEKVRGVISGKVNAVGRLAALYLVVTGANREELLPKKRFPLKDFKLDRKDLTNAVRSIAEAVSTAKDPSDSKPRQAKSASGDEETDDPLAGDEEGEDEPVNAPKKSSKKIGVVVEEEDDSSKKVKKVTEEEAEAEAPKKRAGRGREPREEKEEPTEAVATKRGTVTLGKPGKDTYFASLELGTELYSRNFAYQNQPVLRLRSYGAGIVISPMIYGEIFPFVSRTDLLSGLGAEVGGSWSLGLTSKQAQESTAPHPTAITRYDIAVKYKFRPVASSELQIVPALGFRSTNFLVGEAEDTTQIAGLPNISYFALRLGAGVQMPLAERFTPFFRFELLPVLSAGELIGTNAAPQVTYFPRGSAFGFELALGSGIRVTDHLDVRLAVRLTRYGLSFTSEPTDPFDAEGASDFYVGGTVGLRYLF